MNIVTALAHLQSFDHRACDALLIARGVKLGHVVLKGGSSNGDIYIGSVFVMLWFVTVFGATIWAYAQRRGGGLKPQQRTWLWIGPLLSALGAWFIWIQSSGIVEYVSACRALLADR